MLIALAGQKRCGKDTAAAALMAHGFRRVAFADKLREAAMELDPVIGVDANLWLDSPPVPMRASDHPGHNESRVLVNIFADRFATLLGRDIDPDTTRACLLALDPAVGFEDVEPDHLVHLSDAFENGWDWETLKSSPWADEVRRLLQRLGTEVGRNTLGVDTWVDAVRMEPDEDVVITDCRFGNEADWVHRRGGRVLHIVRPATDDPHPTHPSEVIDFECDATICNDGTIEHLHEETLKWTH